MVAIFEAICERTHKKLISEICPWCGEKFINGERAQDPSATASLWQAGLVGLGDGWLADRLLEQRSGDFKARHSIQLACTSLFMEAIHNYIARYPETDVQELSMKCARECMRLMDELLMSYQGSSAQEFSDQLRAKLADYLQEG